MVTHEEDQANAGRRGPHRPDPRLFQAEQPDPDVRRPAGRPARADQRTLAWLARDLGANRQNVQRIINDLEREGLVTFETNPHHRRAQLVVLTEKGQRAFDEAMDLQAPWVNNLSDGLSVKDIATVDRVVKAMRARLQYQDEREAPA
jgi:DNA-binding MarR family transcriptional regulator